VTYQAEIREKSSASLARCRKSLLLRQSG
jgi:hypothetical protein